MHLGGSKHRLSEQTIEGCRRLCRTPMDYLGMTTYATPEGDEIWIMPGSVTRFLLRKTKQGSHTLVMEDFVSGIMDGEVTTTVHWEQIEIA